MVYFLFMVLGVVCGAGLVFGAACYAIYVAEDKRA
jgi:hypothetical protein